MLFYIEYIEAVLSVLAVIAGGVWVFFNYVRKRTYEEKSILKLNGNVVYLGSSILLAFELSIKNIGNSRVFIRQDATRLSIYGYAAEMDNAAGVRNVDWNHMETSSILLDAEWIEPGEEIRNEALFEVNANNYSCFKAVLQVASKEAIWTDSTIIYDKRKIDHS